MTTQRQIAANRRNATKSTGPKTENGKRRSRRNACRHGLTAETIVNVTEDAAAYEVFEAQIVADNQPRTTIEHELVVRLASLLWRLRRATAIESGLLQIHAMALQSGTPQSNSTCAAGKDKLKLFYDLIPSLNPCTSLDLEPPEISPRDNACQTRQAGTLPTRNVGIASSFSRLAALDKGIFERLGRYETRLWRQLAQVASLICRFEKLSHDPVFLHGELLGLVRRDRS